MTEKKTMLWVGDLSPHYRIWATAARDLNVSLKSAPLSNVTTQMQAENFTAAVIPSQADWTLDLALLVRSGEGGADNVRLPLLLAGDQLSAKEERALERGYNDFVTSAECPIKIEKWLRQGRSVLDSEQLERLQTLGARSGGRLVHELIEIFSVETPGLIRAAREHLGAARLAEVSKAAHSIKSCAANLGVFRVRDLSEYIERSRSAAAHLEAMVGVLEEEYRIALAELQRRF